MPLAAKLAWYYDKTHALIERYSGLFDNYIEIDTEELNSEAARRALSRAVDIEDRVPSPTHLNAMQATLGSVDPGRRYYLSWLLGRLNLAEVAADEVKALDYFIENFLAWTGYQITRAPQLDTVKPPPVPVIKHNLDRAEARLLSALEELKGLRKMLDERNEASAPAAFSLAAD